MFSSTEIPPGFFQDPENKNHYGKFAAEIERSAISIDKCLRTYAVIGNNTYGTSSEKESGAAERFEGYFPFLGFRIGESDMQTAAQQIYKCFVKTAPTTQEYSQRVLKRVKGHWGDVTFTTMKPIKIHFTVLQKMNILARSIALFARGLITYCQLGVIFAPVDAAVNWYYKKG